MPDAVQPYRGSFGRPRRSGLARVALPPEPMPSHDRLRPLKAWRYIGVYGPELMLCAGAVRIGRARQAFWAVWDRERSSLHERTSLGRGRVRLEPGHLSVLEPDVQIDLTFEETPGVETICPTGDSYAWTRKQAGITARGTIALAGDPRRFEACAVIDDTAAYYERHTSWRWSAGVGSTADGRALAWNLVAGVNDPARDSERTLWIDGEPQELGPCRFAEDLTSVGHLQFSAEAVRESDENLLLVRSRYRQPFGTFSGRFSNGVELAQGYGVMEDHDAWW